MASRFNSPAQPHRRKSWPSAWTPSATCICTKACRCVLPIHLTCIICMRWNRCHETALYSSVRIGHAFSTVLCSMQTRRLCIMPRVPEQHRLLPAPILRPLWLSSSRARAMRALPPPALVLERVTRRWPVQRAATYLHSLFEIHGCDPSGRAAGAVAGPDGTFLWPERGYHHSGAVARGTREGTRL